MKISSALAGLALFAGMGSIGSAALAHSKVVASTPAQGSTVSAPRNISLTFSEALIVPTTAVSIVMTAMPGVVNHGEMAIRNFTQSWSDGNRKLTLNLKKPLQSGTYEIRWQAAGADGHRMKGKVGFVVK